MAKIILKLKWLQRSLVSTEGMTEFRACWIVLNPAMIASLKIVDKIFNALWTKVGAYAPESWRRRPEVLELLLPDLSYWSFVSRVGEYAPESDKYQPLKSTNRMDKILFFPFFFSKWVHICRNDRFYCCSCRLNSTGISGWVCSGICTRTVRWKKQGLEAVSEWSVLKRMNGKGVCVRWWSGVEWNGTRLQPHGFVGGKKHIPWKWNEWNETKWANECQLLRAVGNSGVKHEMKLVEWKANTAMPTWESELQKMWQTITARATAGEQNSKWWLTPTNKYHERSEYLKGVLGGRCNHDWGMTERSE